MRMNLSNIGHTFLVYDGVNLSDHFIVRSVDMPLLPSIDSSSIKIDGKAGEWFAKRMIGTRDINVGLGILNDTRNRRDVIESWYMLSDKLSKDKVCKLEIGNGKYVNAILMGETETETNGRWSMVTVSFRCFDPYIYGEEHEEILRTGDNKIYVSGKCATYPIINIAGATDVTITNNGTGDRVRVNGLVSSKTLVVDMANYCCMVDEQYKAADPTVTDFWPIEPGDNTINVSSGTGTLKYREVYI